MQRGDADAHDTKRCAKTSLGHKRPEGETRDGGSGRDSANGSFVSGAAPKEQYVTKISLSSAASATRSRLLLSSSPSSSPSSSSAAGAAAASCCGFAARRVVLLLRLLLLLCGVAVGACAPPPALPYCDGAPRALRRPPPPREEEGGAPRLLRGVASGMSPPRARVIPFPPAHRCNTTRIVVSFLQQRGDALSRHALPRQARNTNIRKRARGR